MVTSAPAKTIEYTHLPLGQEVEIGIGGYYIPQQEVRLPYEGREVLYVIGQAVVESSCCGTGNWKYSIVPGYIASWQTGRNEAGLSVSDVEPIRDDKTQINLRRLIEKTEDAVLVGFW